MSGGGAGCTLVLSPAFSKHARILGATLNGKKLGYKAEPGEQDQHVSVEVNSPGEVSIQVADDFGIVEDADLPPLGSESVNLKIFHEQWSADNQQLTIRLAGVSGRAYELQAYGAKIAVVSGGELKQTAGVQTIQIAFPAGQARYVEREITIRFWLVCDGREIAFDFDLHAMAGDHVSVLVLCGRSRFELSRFSVQVKCTRSLKFVAGDACCRVQQ